MTLTLSDPDLLRQQCLIDGQWRDADGGARCEVRNPANGALLGTVPDMGAAETARATFAEGGAGEDLPHIAASAPIPLVDALVDLGLSASKGEARRLITQGGARVNGEAVTDPAATVSGAGAVRVSAGKKHHGLLVAA